MIIILGILSSCISYQREGYPCLIERDLVGAGGCEKGLVCYTGICTSLVPFAKENNICLLDLGSSACVAGYVCSSTNARRFVQDIKAGTIRAGVCTNIRIATRSVDVLD